MGQLYKGNERLGQSERHVCLLQGSVFGDSQPFSLCPEAVDAAQPNNFVEVMGVWTNLNACMSVAGQSLRRQSTHSIVP